MNSPGSRCQIPRFLPLAVAIACFAIDLFALRGGIGLSSDGWIYWEGSVSLLRGLGYRLFFHNARIIDWPPLFSSYLALFQLALGVSGRTLAIAVAVAAGLSGFLWTRLFLAIAALDDDQEPITSVRLWLVPIFVISFVGTLFRLLLADDLAFALLPGALGSAILLGSQTSLRPRDLGMRLAASSLWLLLCLECKNSALAWAGGTALLVVHLRWRKTARRSALLIGSLVFALPFGGWLLLRLAFGQWKSHAMGLGIASYSALQYLEQALDSAAGMVGPRRFLRLGAVLSAGLLAGITISIRARRNSTSELRRVIESLLLFLGASLAGTGVLLALSGVADEFSGRFVWFAPLTLVSSAIVAWSRQRLPSAADKSLGAIVIIVVALSVFYAARSLLPPEPVRPLPSSGHYAGNDWAIEPGYQGRSAERRGRVLLISPPVLTWERGLRGR